MNDLSELNGHDNLGFDKERNTEPDTTSHQTTITNISSNCSQNATPKRIVGKTRKNSEVKIDPSELSVYERVKMGKELMKKRKSISENNKNNETSSTSNKKTGKKRDKNKETMKYANQKRSTNDDGASKQTGKKGDGKSSKKKIKKQDDENAPKRKHPASIEGENEVGNGSIPIKSDIATPKKKVKIKETMSQRIKKANSNSTGHVKLQNESKSVKKGQNGTDFHTKNENKSKSVKKEQNKTDFHTKNVRYLLDQASDANQKIDKIDHFMKEPGKSEEKLESRKDKTSVIKNSTEASKISPMEDVKHSITINKKNDGKIRTLERVETDDCTSIDTSTLPPPPDEVAERSEDVLSYSGEERFIA